MFHSKYKEFQIRKQDKEFLKKTAIDGMAEEEMYGISEKKVMGWLNKKRQLQKQKGAQPKK